VACLRGFEPPTFGSGEQRSICLQIASHILEQDIPGHFLDLGVMGRLANLGSFQAFLRVQLGRQTTPAVSQIRHKKC